MLESIWWRNRHVTYVWRIKVFIFHLFFVYIFLKTFYSLHLHSYVMSMFIQMFKWFDTRGYLWNVHNIEGFWSWFDISYYLVCHSKFDPNLVSKRHLNNQHRFSLVFVFFLLCISFIVHDDAFKKNGGNKNIQQNRNRRQIIITYQQKI